MTPARTLAATTTAATVGAVLGAVTGWAVHACLGAPLPVHRRPETLPPNVAALRRAAHHRGAIVWPAVERPPAPLAPEAGRPRVGGDCPDCPGCFTGCPPHATKETRP